MTGHVETQIMQTVDCRLQTVQTECNFFLLVPSVSSKIFSIVSRASTMEEGKLFLSVTLLYCLDYLNVFSRRSFFRLSDLK